MRKLDRLRLRPRARGSMVGRDLERKRRVWDGCRVRVLRCPLCRLCQAGELSFVYLASIRVSSPSRTSNDRSRPDVSPHQAEPLPLRQAELENPADAVRILAATASEAEPVLRRPDGPSKMDRIYTWNDWEPVQQGLVSASAAAAMYPLYVFLMASSGCLKNGQGAYGRGRLNV